MMEFKPGLFSFLRFPGGHPSDPHAYFLNSHCLSVFGASLRPAQVGQDHVSAASSLVFAHQCSIQVISSISSASTVNFIVSSKRYLQAEGQYS
eukprot:1140737-Pelagomonas_calceolata.AAC.1